MGAAIKKSLKQHSFIIHLEQEDSERLDQYLRNSGMKKRAFMQKAILKYLGEQERREHEG
jgi:predicted DNA-binding protein